MSAPTIALTAGFLLAAVFSSPFASALDRNPEEGSVHVAVSGEVVSPGEYALRPGERLSDLLRKCGGVGRSAYLRGGGLVRRSEAGRQREELLALRDGLADAGHPLASRLASMHPRGRVPVTLDHPRLMKGTPADIPLEDGDLLEIPLRPTHVSVRGAVTLPSDLPFEPGRSVEWFIGNAGGASPGGDPSRTLILGADGKVRSVERGLLSWNERKSRWEITSWVTPPPSIEPGDLLYVPSGPECGVDLQDGTPWDRILLRLLEIGRDLPPIPCPPRKGKGEPKQP